MQRFNHDALSELFVREWNPKWRQEFYRLGIYRLEYQWDALLALMEICLKKFIENVLRSFKILLLNNAAIYERVRIHFPRAWKFRNTANQNGWLKGKFPSSKSFLLPSWCSKIYDWSVRYGFLIDFCQCRSWARTPQQIEDWDTIYMKIIYLWILCVT